MSIIKKVKVKQSDGTLSENIPLGADAANVSMKDGSSAEKTVSELDVSTSNNMTDKINATRVILYENNKNNNKEDIQLSDDIINYQTLELYGYTQHNTQNPVNFKITMDSMSDKNSISVLTYNDITNSNSYYTNEIITIDKINSKIIRGDQYEISIGPSLARIEGNIYITKIVGVKEQLLKDSEVDYKYSTLEGKEITAYDSIAGMSSKIEKITGNNYQETRSGKNVFDNSRNATFKYESSTQKIETGIRVIATQTNTSNTYTTAVFELGNTTDFLNKIVRVQAISKSSNNTIVPQILLGTANANYTVRTGINQTIKKGKLGQESQLSIEYKMPSEIGNMNEKFAFWLYATSGTPITKDDYTDYTNLIITIDNEDMTYEPYGVSPSPDFPSEIKCVGDNVNEYRLQDILETTNANGITYSVKDGIIILNGTSTKAHNIVLPLLYSLEKSIYTMSTTEVGGTFSGVVGKYIVSSAGSTLIDGGTIDATVTKEITEKSTVKNSFYIGNGVIFNNYKIKIKLEKGSIATPYTKPIENLFDKNKAVMYQEIIIGSDGITRRNGGYFTSDYINVLGLKQIKMSGKENTGSSNCFYDKDKKFISTVILRDGIINVPQNAVYMRFNSVIADLDSAKLEKVGFTEGCTSITISNKNLLVNTAKTQTINGIVHTINSDGTVHSKGTSTAWANLIIYEGNLSKGEYILSSGGITGGIKFMSVHNPTLKKDIASTGTSDNVKFTLDEDTAIQVICCINRGYTIDVVFKPMIRLASITEDTYAKHEEQNYILNTQKPMLQDDYFDFETKEEVHTWKKEILTGDENVGKTVEGFLIDLNIPANQSNLICNTYKTYTGYAQFMNTDYAISQLYTGIKNVYIRDKNCETIEEFKSYLKQQYKAGTPIIVYYQLAEEERLPMNNEQLKVLQQLKNIDTYEDITYITTEDELKPIIKFTYKKNTQK